MLNELHMPVYGFQINEGNHRYLFPTEHAFIFTLARYASKGSSLCSMQHVWHADYSTLSNVFTTVVQWLDEHHGFRLRRIAWFQPRFEEYTWR